MASPNVDPTEDPNRQNLKIMVLGKTGSGKSTFINSVFGKRISTTGYMIFLLYAQEGVPENMNR